MAKDLLNRYVWLVDTIRRYGRSTRTASHRTEYAGRGLCRDHGACCHLTVRCYNEAIVGVVADVSPREP